MNQIVIKVVLVEDEKSIRQSLLELLDKEPDIDVIGEAADGQSAVLLARDVDPDVVVLGVFIPRMNGIRATEAIVSESPGTKVILMSIGFDQELIDHLLNAGASGLVLSGYATIELPIAIREAMEGRIFKGKGVN